MSRIVPNYFAPIRDAARRRWDQLEADPGLAGPWWQLLRQVESPAHVLSELLQNADDAGADAATARVDNGYFEFEHNGHDFSAEELRSLCEFGNSSKKSLLTVGFRGVGFRSLFSLGATIEVLTPTLTIRFERRRFTEPIWLDDANPTSQTHIRVHLDSAATHAAIAASLARWRQTALPLLFFNNLRRLRLDAKELAIETQQPGPCTGASMVRLSGQQDDVLVLRSPAEDFPLECLEEIRQERGAFDLQLPPCDVVVVFHGDETGRLFVVLPTDAVWDLEFSCHAPFLQDPARMKIKDPTLSPTNRWLLERAGRLLGDTLSTWLHRTDLPLRRRAQAYGVVPTHRDTRPETIGDAAALIVRQAFGQTIESADVLLTHDGTLTRKGKAVSLPSVVLETWDADVATRLFDPAQRTPLYPEIGRQALARLADWDLVASIDEAQVIRRLSEPNGRVPAPKPVERLLRLWLALARRAQHDWSSQSAWTNAAIVPVVGSQTLVRARDILADTQRPPEISEAEWKMLTKALRPLDGQWRKIVDALQEDHAAATRNIERLARLRLTREDHGRLQWALNLSGLTQPLAIAQLVDKACATAFTPEKPDTDVAISLTAMVARLGLPAPHSLRFRCAGGMWRAATPGQSGKADLLLSVDAVADLRHLLPRHWYDEHVVDTRYEEAFAKSERGVWRQWALDPQRGGLASFPLPEAQTPTFWRVEELEDFCRARGGHRPTTVPFANSYFGVHDWDWNLDLTNFWRERGAQEPALWQHIAGAIDRSWSPSWEEKLGAVAFQSGRFREQALSTGRLRAGWIERLQQAGTMPQRYRDNRLPTASAEVDGNVPRLYRVVLPVHGIERAAEIYALLLQMPGQRVAPDRHDFDCGGTILSCVDSNAGGDVGQPGERARLQASVAIAVTDLDSVHERAQRSGCQIGDGGVVSAASGERLLWVADPFGNRIGFVDDASVLLGRDPAHDSVGATRDGSKLSKHTATNRVRADAARRS